MNHLGEHFRKYLARVLGFLPAWIAGVLIASVTLCSFAQDVPALPSTPVGGINLSPTTSSQPSWSLNSEITSAYSAGEQGSFQSDDPNRQWPDQNGARQTPSPASPLESSDVRVGYDDGFVIEGRELNDLEAADFPYRLKINGWGQLRHTNFNSQGTQPDLNQFQLIRARLVFSGHAFSPDFSYFVQLDGASNSGDEVTVLDYYLTYDLGHHLWNFEPGTFALKTGMYKMPFTLARYLSGQQFQFADRSVASTFFDVNRSLAWGAEGQLLVLPKPLHWETAIFNGLVTGGAETGSSGDLDNNFAYSFRLWSFPTGEWGYGEQADFEFHCDPATRVGFAAAFSTINRSGSTEFDEIRVVDSGSELASIIPAAIDQYSVALFALDASLKYRGWSFTSEYYFRNINGFQGGTLPDLFDHGFWLEAGYFLVPEKFELLARWSRVMGESGTLGATEQSSDERAAGFVWYWRRQQAKLTIDATYLDGAPINSQSLDIFPGDRGWLARTQIQFSF